MTVLPNKRLSWQISVRHSAFYSIRLLHAAVFPIYATGTTPTQLQYCLVTAWPFVHLMMATDVRGGNLSGTALQ